MLALGSIFFILSIILVIIALVMEVTKTKKILRVSLRSVWYLGIYFAILGLGFHNNSLSRAF